MQRMITSVVVSVLLGGFTVAAAQLPPEIMMDRHLVQAEQLMAEEDHQAALDAMKEVVALQREHDLTLPEEFHFRYAQAAFSAGVFPAALESVNQYLAEAGRDGEFYREALELLIAVELLDEYPAQLEPLLAEKDYEAVRDLMDKIVALHEEHNLTLPDEFRSQYAQVARLTQICAGQPQGAACWMELANQPECYVWNDYYTGQTATWTGECSGGLAQGSGILTWDDGAVQERTGRLQAGKMQGNWVWRYTDPASWGSSEGPYVDGQRHGQWVVRDGDGALDEEGPYVDGQRHGQWVDCVPNSHFAFDVTYVDGEAVSSVSRDSC